MTSRGNRVRLLAAVGVVLAATLTACSSGSTAGPTTTGSATLATAVTDTFGPSAPSVN